MEIEIKDIKDLKAYAKNARRHPKEQIDALAESLKVYGWNQPILIDKHGVIICGHGRLQAAKQLKLKTVPCVVADGLTDEQVREYRLIDNRTAEMSKWNVDLLKLELSELDFGFPAFDFDIDVSKPIEKKPEDYKQSKSLDNFFKAGYEAANEWDIPETKPFTGDLTGIEWTSFGEKARIENPEKTGVHFYIDDYKFESVWRSPDKWLELFQKCGAVVTPDFSNYTDMPRAQQLWNHYRRQWLGRYWQERGVNVISSLSWANGQIFDWSFAGIPEGTTVAVSFVGDAIDKQAGIDELMRVIGIVKPYRIFIKAGKTDAEVLRKYVDFELIPPYNWRG